MPAQPETLDFYSLGLAAAFIVIITGIFMGAGKNRSLIVFRDYDDLGLTFLIPVSFILITLLFANAGGHQGIGILLASGVAAILFVKLAINTYLDNGRSILKALLALIVKVPLSWIWMLNLLQLLNPQGTGNTRRKNRAQALIILTLLTPIIGLVIADKSGSFFNPRGWLRGRRGVSTVRNHL